MLSHNFHINFAKMSKRHLLNFAFKTADTFCPNWIFCRSHRLELAISKQHKHTRNRLITSTEKLSTFPRSTISKTPTPRNSIHFHIPHTKRYHISETHAKTKISFEQRKRKRHEGHASFFASQDPPRQACCLDFSTSTAHPYRACYFFNFLV